MGVVKDGDPHNTAVFVQLKRGHLDTPLKCFRALSNTMEADFMSTHAIQSGASCDYHVNHSHVVTREVWCTDSAKTEEIARSTAELWIEDIRVFKLTLTRENEETEIYLEQRGAQR